jgi:hypothetical protein
MKLKNKPGREHLRFIASVSACGNAYLQSHVEAA